MFTEQLEGQITCGRSAVSTMSRQSINHSVGVQQVFHEVSCRTFEDRMEENNE